VVGVEFDDLTVLEFSLKADFGVTHGIAVLQSIVGDGNSRQAARACTNAFNHERHERWVVDTNVKVSGKRD
jgi:hypothetical protein